MPHIISSPPGIPVSRTRITLASHRIEDISVLVWIQAITTDNLEEPSHGFLSSNGSRGPCYSVVCGKLCRRTDPVQHTAQVAARDCHYARWRTHHTASHRAGRDCGVMEGEHNGSTDHHGHQGEDQAVLRQGEPGVARVAQDRGQLEEGQDVLVQHSSGSLQHHGSQCHVRTAPIHPRCQVLRPRLRPGCGRPPGRHGPDQCQQDQQHLHRHPHHGPPH